MKIENNYYWLGSQLIVETHIITLLIFIFLFGKTMWTKIHIYLNYIRTSLSFLYHYLFLVLASFPHHIKISLGKESCVGLWGGYKFIEWGLRRVAYDQLRFGESNLAVSQLHMFGNGNWHLPRHCTVQENEEILAFWR